MCVLGVLFGLMTFTGVVMGVVMSRLSNRSRPRRKIWTRYDGAPRRSVAPAALHHGAIMGAAQEQQPQGE